MSALLFLMKNPEYIYENLEAPVICYNFLGFFSSKFIHSQSVFSHNSYCPSVLVFCLCCHLIALPQYAVIKNEKSYN